ncbi:unnamed protein product [Dicrocoelium dendriticum]|nr:unnamed protein product [Dicrocoelium dendriticum]
MACVWIILLLTIAIARLPKQVHRTPLNGSWEIRSSKQDISIEVISGADMFSALWTKGIISDPLSGKQDSQYRSHAWEDWTFQHIFRTAPKRTQNEVTELCWDGIDTFCDVALNGIILGTGNNSFLYVCWDVSQYIRPDAENELKLVCQSTLRTANRTAMERKKRGQPTAPPECWRDEQHGECNINLVRTTQASTSWDWGPAFPIQGFWHPPCLITSPSNIRLGEGFKFYSFVNKDTFAQRWSAYASVEVLRPSDRGVLKGSETLCIIFMLDSWSPPNGKTCFAMARNVTQKDVRVSILTNSDGIEPWWPNGMFSGPRTYDLSLTLSSEDDFVLDQAQYLVGFREVQLVEVSTTLEGGASFVFFHFCL